MSVNDEELEVDLLLEAIRRKSGHDFRNYARASLCRRIRQQVAVSGVASVAELIPRVLGDPSGLDDLLAGMSVTVTEMFRDPTFFLALRERVVPVLRTYPRLRVWVPGCATGQEAYALALLLEEEGLYDRTRIYATDFNRRSLATAKDGVYAERDLPLYEENYRKAGGRGSLVEHCKVGYERFRMPETLKRNLVFARHNLATDASFGETHLVVCRNVLIYFDRSLQDRVVGVFHESLCPQGYLALGPKETVEFTSHAQEFEVITREERIYRRSHVH